MFTLGASSDLFLLLRIAGSDAKAALGIIPWLWIGLHIVKALSNLGGGWVSDRLGARPTLVLGWSLYGACYVAFGLVQSHTAILVLIMIYGLYYGLTEGPEKALVARLSAAGHKAEAFGWYHLIVGLGVLPANLLFGWLYDRVSPQAAFFTSAGFAFAGLTLLVIWRTPIKIARLAR